jgi:hypothetical protein
MDTAIGNSVPVSRVPQGQFTGRFDNQSEHIELAKSIGQGVIRGMGLGVAQRLTRRIARRVARQMSRKAVAWLASRRLWSPRVVAAAPSFQRTRGRTARDEGAHWLRHCHWRGSLAQRS